MTIGELVEYLEDHMGIAEGVNDDDAHAADAAVVADMVHDFLVNSENLRNCSLQSIRCINRI